MGSFTPLFPAGSGGPRQHSHMHERLGADETYPVVLTFSEQTLDTDQGRSRTPHEKQYGLLAIR